MAVFVLPQPAPDFGELPVYFAEMMTGVRDGLSVVFSFFSFAFWHAYLRQ
jgi:hypothetical protein